MSGNQHTSIVASAASRVLDTTELLEHILLQLRPATAANTLDTESGDDGNSDTSNGSETSSHQIETKGNRWSDGVEDLFVVQRVCRRWKTVIKGSVNLRRAMLLEYADLNNSTADQKYGLEYLLDPNTAALKLHPALPCIQELVDNTGLNGKPQKLVRIRFSEHKVGGTAFLVGPAVSFVGCEGNSTAEGIKCRGKGHILNLAAARAVYPQKLHSNASWRRMKLFAQPTQVQVQMSIKAGFPGAYWRTIIIDDERSQVGNVYDALEAIATSRFKQHGENGQACWEMMDKMMDGADAWGGGSRYDSPDVRAALETKTEHDSKFCRVSTGDCQLCSAVAALAYDPSDRRSLLRFFAEADPRMVPPKPEPVQRQKFYESDKENYDDSGFFEPDEYNDSDKEN